MRKTIAHRMHCSVSSIKALKREVADQWDLDSPKQIVGEYVKRYFRKNYDHKAEHDLPTPEARQLRGIWLSRFRYKTKQSGASRAGIQYTIEKVSSLGGEIVQTEAVYPWHMSDRQGDEAGYMHEINGTVRNVTIGNHKIVFLRGIWNNKNTNNWGNVLLRSRPGVADRCDSLQGAYVGVSTDTFVRADNWDWVRIADKFDDEFLERLKNNNIVYNEETTRAIDCAIDNGRPILLKDVLKLE